MSNMITKFLISIGAFILTALIAGIMVMLFWNWLMPTLFKLPNVSYMQATGLYVLCNLLFNDDFEIRKNND